MAGKRQSPQQSGRDVLRQLLFCERNLRRTKGILEMCRLVVLRLHTFLKMKL